MILLAAAFVLAGVLVLKDNPSRRRPSDSVLYRTDEIVVSGVLFILGATLAALALFGLRPQS